MTTMTLTDPEWTTEAKAEAWAEDETTADIAGECADLELAWMINNIGSYLPSGWRLIHSGFEGPACDNAHSAILAMITEAVDYVISAADEIRAEADD